MDDTFYMSNISPQVADMNRGFWAKLEKFVRNLMQVYDDVFVCTGPMFVPEFEKISKTWHVSYRVVGPKHDIAVPTHFFKCVHATGNGDMPAAQGCFMVPNRSIDIKSERLSSFVVPVDLIEHYTGLELFPALRHGGVKHAKLVDIDDNAIESAAATSNSTSIVVVKPLCDQVKCDLTREKFVMATKRRTE